jgi:hypothetical protein
MNLTLGMLTLIQWRKVGGWTYRAGAWEGPGLESLTWQEADWSGIGVSGR